MPKWHSTRWPRATQHDAAAPLLSLGFPSDEQAAMPIKHGQITTRHRRQVRLIFTMTHTLTIWVLTTTTEKSLKARKLSLAIGAIFSAPVFAQQLAEQAIAQDKIEQVTVTGIRASVRNALAAKEASNSMVEVITSEDIGKLPDTTIAESLARLPGMSSGIDRGNASQVIARGLGPRFIGATLNGRELASPEPARAVRFEQFPSESISGATISKTQSAELVEGGIATSIDLQTVQPLRYRERQASLKADALYYPLAKDIPGLASSAPRLGGIYIDQFAGHTVGVALAFSYQDQPSMHKNIRHWGYNETNSADLNGDGKADKTPWGFNDEVKRGKNKRSSLLGKVEWKASPDATITADAYYSKADMFEPGLQHWSGDLGNWDGYKSADFSQLDIRNGYVVGATLANSGLITNDYVWWMNANVLASGLNGKFNAGDWKLEADLSISEAKRDSQWQDLRLSMNTPTATSWGFTGDNRQLYSFSADSGNPALFSGARMYVNNDEHLKDELRALHLNASRSVELGAIQKLKFGVRLLDREKNFRQTSWDMAPTSAIPASAWHTVSVPGLAPFIALNDFYGTAYSAFGSKVFDASGRPQTQGDLLAGWRVKETGTAWYAQGDLDGSMFGTAYRGNAGIRVVHTRQTGAGMQSINGAAPTPVEAGTSYTQVLPSANLIYLLDEKQQHQLRISAARAMARAPLDEMRGSRNLNDQNPLQPLTGSAGNPALKPMLSDQLDVAYQWYFGKGGLVSAGLFYKDISRYIGITGEATSIDGRAATITRSINGKGGQVHGVELVYQQQFSALPAPFDGLGISSNYAYTASNIKENIPVQNPFPVEGLMKHNGGVTLWYEKAGYEVRVSANYHSPFVRNPTWTAGRLSINEAETYLAMNFSKKLSDHWQLHFGIENLTNQKVTYTSDRNPYAQEVTEFGRRFNLGLSYKL